MVRYSEGGDASHPWRNLSHTARGQPFEKNATDIDKRTMLDRLCQLVQPGESELHDDCFWSAQLLRKPFFPIDKAYSPCYDSIVIYRDTVTTYHDTVQEHTEAYYGSLGSVRTRSTAGGGRFGRGDLRLVILEMLEDHPSYGYEIMRALEQRFHGFYSPSAGTIYPTLQWLQDLGYVTVSEQEGRKNYTITEEGRRFLAAGEPRVDEIWERMRGWAGPFEQREFRDEMRRFTDEMRELGRDVLRRGPLGQPRKAAPGARGSRARRPRDRGYPARARAGAGAGPAGPANGPAGDAGPTEGPAGHTGRSGRTHLAADTQSG